MRLKHLSCIPRHVAFSTRPKNAASSLLILKNPTHPIAAYHKQLARHLDNPDPRPFRRILDELREHPRIKADEYVYGLVLQWMIRNENREGFDAVWEEMVASGVEADLGLFTNLYRSIELKKGALSMLTILDQKLEACNISPGRGISTRRLQILLSLRYSTQELRYPEMAFRMFENMASKEPTLLSSDVYSEMMLGLESVAYGEKPYSRIQELAQQGKYHLSPGAKLSWLTQCARARHVESAERLWFEVYKQGHFPPIATLYHLLFAASNPIKPSARLASSILSHILEHHPTLPLTTTILVPVMDAYAYSGRWNDVVKLLSGMVKARVDVGPKSGVLDGLRAVFRKKDGIAQMEALFSILNTVSVKREQFQAAPEPVVASEASTEADDGSAIKSESVFVPAELVTCIMDALQRDHDRPDLALIVFRRVTTQWQLANLDTHPSTTENDDAVRVKRVIENLFDAAHTAALSTSRARFARRILQLQESRYPAVPPTTYSLERLIRVVCRCKSDPHFEDVFGWMARIKYRGDVISERCYQSVVGRLVEDGDERVWRLVDEMKGHGHKIGKALERKLDVLRNAAMSQDSNGAPHDESRQNV